MKSRLDGTPVGVEAGTRPDARRAAAGVLYLCYLGISEPLVQTQVIPYLRGLAAAGHRVALLTFEPAALRPEEREAHRMSAASAHLEWQSLRYHKRPAVPATLVDVICGVGRGAQLMRRHGLTVVHARGHVPALMALVLKWLRGAAMVFDIRGLVADEYVDAGLWRRHGALYRLAKRVEAVLLAKADGVVVLTRRARAWVATRRPGSDAPVEVIPCCVEVHRFQIDRRRVDGARAALGFGDDPVLVYAGKLGGWYLTSEMAEFFQTARRMLPRLRFLVLTQSDRAGIEAELKRRGIAPGAFRCVTVPPDALPVYLSAATFAVSFIRPCFSKMAASPTKMAEYLAAGVPVVYNGGIGDLDELDRERIGARIAGFASHHYEAAIRQILVLLMDPQATARRCRAVAERCFSLDAVGVPRYLRLYERLLNGGAGVPSSAPAARSSPHRAVASRSPRARLRSAPGRSRG